MNTARVARARMVALYRYEAAPSDFIRKVPLTGNVVRDFRVNTSPRGGRYYTQPEQRCGV